MIDAAVVMPSILTYTGRQVSNLVPTIWMKTKFIGCLAKCSGALALQRPVDLKKKGSGILWLPDPVKEPLSVHGSGTRFDIETRPGDYLVLPRYNNAVAVSKIDKIVSAEELVLEYAFSPMQNAVEQTFPKGSAYFVASKLDRTGLYSQVSAHLAKEGSLLIFPEGCSHDTGGLLPFYGMYHTK